MKLEHHLVGYGSCSLSRSRIILGWISANNLLFSNKTENIRKQHGIKSKLFSIEWSHYVHIDDKDVPSSVISFWEHVGPVNLARVVEKWRLLCTLEEPQENLLCFFYATPLFNGRHIPILECILKNRNHFWFLQVNVQWKKRCFETCRVSGVKLKTS